MVKEQEFYEYYKDLNVLIPKEKENFYIDVMSCNKGCCIDMGSDNKWRLCISRKIERIIKDIPRKSSAEVSPGPEWGIKHLD